MLIFKFNDKSDIEDMIARHYVNEDNYYETIKQLAIYNYHELHLEKQDNYDAIKTYMTKYANDFFEPEYMDVIYDKIVQAKRSPYVDIDSIAITRQELDRIVVLDDIRKEKIAFVLLAVAKYNDAKYQNNNHCVTLSNMQVCKLARVTMSCKERDAFMSFLISDGIVTTTNSSKSKAKFVQICTEECVEDDIAMILHEIDFEELAYTYQKWKSNGVGFGKCQGCGITIKQGKTKPRKYCENCAKDAERASTRDRVRRYREKCNGNLTPQND